MVKVIRSTVFDAPTDNVWAVMRDFSGHDRWHPTFEVSQTDRDAQADRVGVVRRVVLKNGSELRERLLTLSEMERSLSYCLLETPLPLFNYVAHVRLFEVTDGNRTFAECEAQFDAPAEHLAEMQAFVGDELFGAGFTALRRYLDLPA